MDPFTMLLLILAAALLLLSCFLPEKKEEQTLAPDEELFARLAKRELSQEELQRIQEAVDRVISEKTEEAIIKTDDYLSKVANEKIIAVDEFSKQIMERLGKDNSDAAFLYKMIAEAKEELKSDITEARKEKLALEKLMEEKEAKEPEQGTAKKAGNQNAAGREKTAFIEENREEEQGRATRRLPVSGAENEKKLQTRVPSRKKAEAPDGKTDDITRFLEDFYGQGGSEPEPEQEKEEPELPKDRILALHKKGYSVREISKELSMGQGEVKLVIELYGA